MERNPGRQGSIGSHAGKQLIPEGPQQRRLCEHVLGGGDQRIEACGVSVGWWHRGRLRDCGTQTGNTIDEPFDHPRRDELGPGTA